MRVEKKAMLSSFCIENFLVFWTRLANSKAKICVEAHVPQEFTAVKPIIVSTCCCFKSCDIQILLECFSIAAIIQVLRGLLLILVLYIGDRLRLNRLCSTVGLQAICVCIFGCPTMIQNVAFFS